MGATIKSYQLLSWSYWYSHTSVFAVRYSRNTCLSTSLAADYFSPAKICWRICCIFDQNIHQRQNCIERRFSKSGRKVHHNSLWFLINSRTVHESKLQLRWNIRHPSNRRIRIGQHSNSSWNAQSSRKDTIRSIAAKLRDIHLVVSQQQWLRTGWSKSSSQKPRLPPHAHSSRTHTSSP